MVTHSLVVMLSFEPACPRARFGLGYIVRADARSSCKVKDPLDRRVAVDSLEAATGDSCSAESGEASDGEQWQGGERQGHTEEVESGAEQASPGKTQSD